MSSMTRTSIHGVTAISVKHDDKGWVTLTFTDQWGGQHETVAFVDKPIVIDWAEFINQQQEQPA